MAQLKDLIVAGASRFLGDIFASSLQTNTLKAPTSSGGSTYGPGSNGQVLKSNGTNIYWTSDTDTDTKVTNTANNSTKYYITGTTSSSTNTGTQIFDTGVYVNTTAGELVATKFTGPLTGNVTGNVSGSSGSCTGNAASASKVNNKLTLANDRSYDGSAAVTLLTNDLTPAISKTYSSTSYYASGDNDTSTCFYFLSVRPDSWYKPWTVRFKVRTTIPNQAANYDSVTYSTITGSANNISYANWNQRYDYAHYYLPVYTLNQTGYNAGYSHGIGISIRYSNNYTNSTWYRKFEVDYYDCDGCTVTVLDAPLLQGSWNGNGSTNFYTVNNTNAVDRGLQESGDSNSGDYNQRDYYFRPYVGTTVYPYKLCGIDSTNRVQPLVTTNGSSSGKQTNTVGIKGSIGLYYSWSGSTYSANNPIGGTVLYRSGTISPTYTFNGSIAAYQMVYLKGDYAADTDLFTLPSSTSTDWYVSVPTNSSSLTLSTYFTSGKYYMLVGGTYSSANNFSLFDHNPIYYFDGTNLIPVAAMASKVSNKLTIGSYTYDGSSAVSIPIYTGAYT